MEVAENGASVRTVVVSLSQSGEAPGDVQKRDAIRVALRSMSNEDAAFIGAAGSRLLGLCALYDEIVENENDLLPGLRDSADIAATMIKVAVGYLAVIGHIRGFDGDEAGRIVHRLRYGAQIIDDGTDDAPGTLRGAVVSLGVLVADREVGRIADAVLGLARVAAVADFAYDDHAPRLKSDATAVCRWLSDALHDRTMDDEEAGLDVSDGRLRDPDVMTSATAYIDSAETLIRHFLKRAGDEANAEVLPYSIDASRRIEALGALGEDATLAGQILLDGKALLSQARDVLTGAVERDPAALTPASASAALACCAVAEGMARMLRFEAPTLARVASILRRSTTVIGTPDETHDDLSDVLDRAIDSCESEMVVDVAKCSLALVGMAGQNLSDGHRDRLIRLLCASADAVDSLTRIDPASIDGPEAAGRVWAHLPDEVHDNLAWRTTPEWTAAFMRSARESYNNTVLARIFFANARANEVAERF